MQETNRTTGRRAPARGDVTALQQQQLDEQRDQERAEATAAAAAARQVEEYTRKNEVIDYSGADQPLPEPERRDDSDEPYREIIAKYDIPQMTFGREIVEEVLRDERNRPVLDDDGSPVKIKVPGRIRELNFREGRRYRVPKALADHMDERGLVWH